MNSFSPFQSSSDDAILLKLIASKQTIRRKGDYFLSSARDRFSQREEETPETETSEETIQYVFRFACVNQISIQPFVDLPHSPTSCDHTVCSKIEDPYSHHRHSDLVYHSVLFMTSSYA